MKKKTKALIIVLSAIAALAVLFVVYINTYYHAQPEAEAVAGIMEERGDTLYFKGVYDTGFIIYPGGKVEAEAYAPLASLLNANGHTVAIAKMPFHLSILDNYKAEEIISQNPEIANWILIGHSLGGTSASMCAYKYPEHYAGIVFLASYPYKDISNQDISTLSIEGSEDRVLDKNAVEKAKGKYPKNTRFEVIEGGNHSGFGDYDMQQGDGEADISWQEQEEITVEMILELIGQ